MKNILFLFACLLVFCVSPVKAETPQWLIDSGCYAVYRVPEGHPYNTRVVRPPFWTMNRWECLKESVSFTNFQNSPANGTDTQFYLALAFVIDPPVISYYPILYVDESRLHIYTDDNLAPTEHFNCTIEQGTGKVTFPQPPSQGLGVYFEIRAQ